MIGKILLIILVPTAAFCILFSFIKGIVLSKHRFLCSQCNKEFYPKWYQVMFESHFGEYYKIKCPHCNKKEYHRSID